MKLSKEIHGFKTFILKHSSELAKNADANELAKFVENNIAYVFALDLEKKINGLLTQNKSIVNSSYQPEWYRVPLKITNYFYSITYEFLPALNEMILRNDLFYRNSPQEM